MGLLARYRSCGKAASSTRCASSGGRGLSASPTTTSSSSGASHGTMPSSTSWRARRRLSASRPSTLCVPSRSSSSSPSPTDSVFLQDLAWHTHQLKREYKLDTALATGRFVDHDDKVEEGALATGFDVTARAWKVRRALPLSCSLRDLSMPLTLANTARRVASASPTRPAAAPSPRNHPSRASPPSSVSRPPPRRPRTRPAP